MAKTAPFGQRGRPKKNSKKCAFLTFLDGRRMPEITISRSRPFSSQNMAFLWERLRRGGGCSPAGGKQTQHASANLTPAFEPSNKFSLFPSISGEQSGKPPVSSWAKRDRISLFMEGLFNEKGPTDRSGARPRLNHCEKKRSKQDICNVLAG